MLWYLMLNESAQLSERPGYLAYVMNHIVRASYMNSV